MQVYNLTSKEKELLIKLSSLVSEYGFKEVLYLLEQMVSVNNFEGSHWECIRKNLENSILEIEELNISDNIN